MKQQRKAVALISGGLDSMLAVRVIQEQGIHVEGINFFTGFCVEGHTHAVRKKHKDKQIILDFQALSKEDFLALTASQKYELLFDILKEMI